MKQTNKINAFTLSEMMVVLILTAIVVALAFTVLSLVQKHMYSIENNFKTKTTINRLETSLSLDFNRNGYIIYNKAEQELKFKSELGSVSYEFYDDFIVKEEDTFKVKTQYIKLFFNGEEVNDNDIDAIKVSFEEIVNNNIFVFKRNDANVYLN